MAGDWIKVEHATLDKPEILRTAEMLGIGLDAALGLYFRYWSWLDKNLSGSCPGFVRNVSRKSLDEFLHCPGFSACLVAVGWAEFDDAAWSLRVVNAERHNGNTAKSRALDNKRKAEKRPVSVREMSGSQPEQNRTREEKRREEIPTAVGIESPTDEHRSLASELAVSCDVEWQKYRDHLKTHGKRHKDLADGFRNWLRKAAEFKAPKGREPSLAERRATNIDILTGRASGRDIPFAERVDRPAIRALPSDLREPGGDDVGAGGPVGGTGGVERLARAV